MSLRVIVQREILFGMISSAAKSSEWTHVKNGTSIERYMLLSGLNYVGQHLSLFSYGALLVTMSITFVEKKVLFAFFYKL